jgi:hypothetical protein
MNKFQQNGSTIWLRSGFQVQAEILASVNRIRCSILGRKGGLLHSYSYGNGIDQVSADCRQIQSF